MGRFLSLLLIAAMLLSVCTIFTGCDDSDYSRKEDDEDEKTTLKFNGLDIVLPDDFELASKDGSIVTFESDEYFIHIESGVMTGAIKGLDSEELRDYCATPKKPGEFSKLETGKKNGTPYYYALLYTEEDARAAAFYTDDDYFWVVTVSNTASDTKINSGEMIKLITGWKCKAPKQNSSGNQD